MLQKFKIAFYAIIVWLVLPSQAVAENPHLNGIPAANQCGGWDCSQNPDRQLCLKGTPGAERESYICMHERDYKWIAARGGTKTRADKALEWRAQRHLEWENQNADPSNAAETTEMFQAVAENPHLNGIPAANQCGGWDCSQNPDRQLCLKGTPGAERESYICMHERDYKWIAARGGTKTRADKALEWRAQRHLEWKNQNADPSNADPSNADPTGCAGDPSCREAVADVFRIVNDITTDNADGVLEVVEQGATMHNLCPEAYSPGSYGPPAHETKAAALCQCAVIDDRLNKISTHQAFQDYRIQQLLRRTSGALMEWGVIYQYEDYKEYPEAPENKIRGIKRPVPMYKSCVALEQ